MHRGEEGYDMSREGGTQHIEGRRDMMCWGKEGHDMLRGGGSQHIEGEDTRTMGEGDDALCPLPPSIDHFLCI